MELNSLCMRLICLHSSVFPFKSPTSIKSQQGRGACGSLPGVGSHSHPHGHPNGSQEVSVHTPPHASPHGSAARKHEPSPSSGSHRAPRGYLCGTTCSLESSKSSSLVCECQMPRRGSPRSHSPATDQERGHQQPGHRAPIGDGTPSCGLCCHASWWGLAPFGLYKNPACAAARASACPF